MNRKDWREKLNKPIIYFCPGCNGGKEECHCCQRCHKPQLDGALYPEDDDKICKCQFSSNMLTEEQHGILASRRLRRSQAEGEARLLREIMDDVQIRNSNFIISGNNIGNNE